MLIFKHDMALEAMSISTSPVLTRREKRSAEILTNIAIKLFRDGVGGGWGGRCRKENDVPFLALTHPTTGMLVWARFIVLEYANSNFPILPRSLTSRLYKVNWVL